MSRAKVGDLIRVLPYADAVESEWALPCEVVEVIRVNTDNSGVIAKGSLDSYIPLSEREYVIHRKADEESACDNCGKQGVHTCRGAEYYAGQAEQDVVNSPNHYTQGRVEVIDIIEDAVKGADPFEAVCQANVLKYALRYRHKNGVEDLRKSIWYTEKLIEHLDAKTTQD